MYYQVITSRCLCDNPKCKAWRPVSMLKTGIVHQSKLPENWEQVSVHQMTPTGRYRRRGGYISYQFCQKCKKMGKEKMETIARKHELDRAQRRAAKKHQKVV